MGDLGEERLGVGHAKLQVLGRDPVADSAAASDRSRTTITAP
jgi:hypothetical protein